MLLIRLGAMGDVVRTLPAASALRRAYADAHLAWLVEPGSAALLESQSWLDRVLVFPRPALQRDLARGRPDRAWRRARAFLRALRDERFDLVVDFHAILKSGVLARLSGAPVRVGYARPFAREGAWLFANRRAQVSPRRVSRFERNAALVHFLGLDPAAAPSPLQVPEPLLVEMGEQLGGEAPVVLHPGTSDATVHKRWTVAGYARLARALAEDPGATVLVSVGPARDDRRFGDALLAAADGAARPAPATPTLAHLAALMAHARLYVGSDTGPMHVASLLGTPVVQLLGPTHPVENAPWPATPSRTVHVPLACSPCGRRGCDAATCMRVIPVASVVASARAILAAAGPG